MLDERAGPYWVQHGACTSEWFQGRQPLGEIRTQFGQFSDLSPSEPIKRARRRNARIPPLSPSVIGETFEFVSRSQRHPWNPLRMDSAIESSALVATVFATGHQDDPYRLFREFLQTHMISFHTARVLKPFSSEDHLVVTEYLFNFESGAEADLCALRTSAYHWGLRFGIDVAIQYDDVYRRYKRLVVFDMDSTLIKQEVVDEIAKYLDSVNPEKNVGALVAVTST